MANFFNYFDGNRVNFIEKNILIFNAKKRWIFINI